ncbi:hypothetical protein SARC_10787 [Sphaeroforma arctica JP610]|uniref:Kinesin-like protein n=1 Tax=Sphaeroforma arctica JP610 TaxID=667725 RepID=A0A0L0FJ01_9EUKA|nr:hypothetical protein SARC_10787 [Sphaeroforma arctica JP610]KNC76730.1 hypothetical protein SARC_10787 [Sphaeroforma arctica JP610]|eukprot:XP_014150632.1 hypothetical protein SARC_10787 [Sphaeroforma arctica JP610]
MLGTETEPGVMVLTIQELYRRMEENASEKTYEISVTYVEVYNEILNDLMEPSKKNLPLREDKEQGMVVSGLSKHLPKSAEELFSLLAKGNLNRTQHPTDANATSSRSHAVFTVHIDQRDRTASLNSEVRRAKLLLIDLAGSERASATTNQGARMLEGAKINKSLLALGNCINSLVHMSDLRARGKGQSFHVPYRDSKLTRLLKDSLGGNSRTVMIANVSSSGLWYEDTHNSLKYANRAKSIKVRAIRNTVTVAQHVSEYKNIVEKLKQEIVELKTKLDAAERGVGRTRTPTPSGPLPPDPQQLSIARELSGHIQQLANQYATALESLDSALRQERALALYRSQLKRVLDRVDSVFLSEATRDGLAKQLRSHVDQVSAESATVKSNVHTQQERVNYIISEYQTADRTVKSRLEDKSLKSESLLELAQTRATVEIKWNVTIATLKDVIELQRQEIVRNEGLLHTLARLVGTERGGHAMSDAEVYQIMSSMLSVPNQAESLLPLKRGAAIFTRVSPVANRITRVTPLDDIPVTDAETHMDDTPMTDAMDQDDQEGPLKSPYQPQRYGDTQLSTTLGGSSAVAGAYKNSSSEDNFRGSALTGMSMDANTHTDSGTNTKTATYTNTSTAVPLFPPHPPQRSVFEPETPGKVEFSYQPVVASQQSHTHAGHADSNTLDIHNTHNINQNISKSTGTLQSTNITPIRPRSNTTDAPRSILRTPQIPIPNAENKKKVTFDTHHRPSPPFKHSPPKPQPSQSNLAFGRSIIYSNGPATDMSKTLSHDSSRSIGSAATQNADMYRGRSNSPTKTGKDSFSTVNVGDTSEHSLSPFGVSTTSAGTDSLGSGNRRYSITKQDQARRGNRTPNSLAFERKTSHNTPGSSTKTRPVSMANYLKPTNASIARTMNSNTKKKSGRGSMYGSPTGMYSNQE